MPYIAPEVITEAKRMDLLTYLQNYEPHELVHFSGNTYCTRSHDSLKISNGKWFWWSRGIGGRSALDYLIKVRELSFTDAVEQIMGRAASTPPVFASPKEQKPKALLLPEPYPIRMRWNAICCAGASTLHYSRPASRTGEFTRAAMSRRPARYISTPCSWALMRRDRKNMPHCVESAAISRVKPSAATSITRLRCRH